MQQGREAMTNGDANRRDSGWDEIAKYISLGPVDYDFDQPIIDFFTPLSELMTSSQDMRIFRSTASHVSKSQARSPLE